MKNQSKRWLGAIEVAATILLFFYLKDLLEASNFGEWQEPIFGSAIITSCLLFFVLPTCVAFLRGRSPSALGFTVDNWPTHRRAGFRAIAFIAPATTLFPVLGFLGTTPYEWFGSSILAVGFIVVGFLFAKHSSGLAVRSDIDLQWTDVLPYLGLFVLGLVLCFLLLPLSPLLTRLVTVLIFVGMLEETFFRGYVQTGLNEAFGTPFEFHGVNFGVGLIVSAAVFGLAHPLSAVGNAPWAWALWTAAFGLVTGFLREKTGSIVAPAMLHGVVLIPGVLFGHVG